MPEVQNVGAVDYAQYQPSQYQYDDYAGDYNTQPAIYDEENAEIKAASKSHLGQMALSAIVLGTLGYFGGRYMGKKAGAKEVEQLNDVAAKYKEFAEKTIPELEKEADKVRNSNIFYWKRGGAFADKVKEELGKFKKLLNDVKDGGEKVAEDTKKAADDAGKKGNS